MTTKAIFPLVYKAGIKRDGTQFQSEYCTSGQWIRFQRGVIRTIGGLYGLNVIGLRRFTNRSLSNLFSVSSTVSNNFYVYCATTVNGTNGIIERYTFNSNFEKVGQDLNIITFDGNSVTTQFEVIIKNGVRQLVIFNASNAINIEQNSPPYLIYGPIDNPQPFTQVNINDAGIDPKGNGGICYFSPYLFIYGSNGYVAYSRDNDPLDFREGNGSGELEKISQDKVIYGSPIRGGSNSPSLLFWTMSSVVRVINVGDNEVNFRSDTISNSSSVLSSRCIVEYDGLFFWPGIDTFFVYTGTVVPMRNDMNLNYFYDNIDMNYRQMVFGVKKPKFNEIWWFYPTKRQAAGQVKNTRAIIYNKKLDTWYDTEISMECGHYFQSRGYTITLGDPLVRTDPNGLSHLWVHEVGTLQSWYGRGVAPNRTRTEDRITAEFTTPTFSWVAFNPLKQQTGIDKWMELRRIEPDFQIEDVQGNLIRVFPKSKEYAQSIEVTGSGYEIRRTTNKIDLNFQGRNMRLLFRSDYAFEVGNILLSLSVGDGQ